MATTVNWATKIINVGRADLLLIQASPEIRQMDLDAFRLDLKALEAGEEGMSYLDTHTHNTTVTVGGVTLARVIEIINGYTVTFEDGQYAVNLVGANSNVADVANVNQVSVRSANSAGLTYSDAINKQSFLGGAVYIDPVDGLPGTSFPRGTPTDPVDNFADAKLIAEANNFNHFVLDGQLTLSISEDTDGSTWEGRGPVHSDLTLSGGNIDGSDLQRLLLSGQSNGVTSMNECLLNGITDFKGSAKECQIRGNITVDATNTSLISFTFCSSSVAGSGTPVLDFNSAACDGEFRFYSGGIEIRNFNQGQNLSIDVLAGHVKIASSCTSGAILIRGSCKVTDESAGATVNVDDATNIELKQIKLNTNLIPATL
jgi:hypothetical protein